MRFGWALFFDELDKICRIPVSTSGESGGLAGHGDRMEEH